MKLTYRDKILLIGAVVVIIWAIGIFLIIKPAFTTMNETSNTRDSKDNEVVMLEERVEKEKNLKDELQKAYDDAVEHSDEYFYKLEPKDEVADVIKDILLTDNREIDYTTFAIQDLSVESISSYDFSDVQVNSFLDYQAKTIQNAGIDQSAAQDILAGTVANAYTVGVYNVDTDFKCDIGDLFDFADNLLTSNQKSFILQEVAIQFGEEGKSLVGVDSGEIEGSITYKYYMAPEIPKPAALGGDDDKKDEAKEDK